MSKLVTPRKADTESTKEAQRLAELAEIKRNQEFEKHLEALRNAKSKIDCTAPQVHAANFTKLRNHARDAQVYMRRMADNVAILTRIVTVLQTKSKTVTFRTRDKKDAFKVNQEAKYVELKRIRRDNLKMLARIRGAVSKTDTGLGELVKQKTIEDMPLEHRIETAPDNLGWFEKPYMYLYFDEDNGDRVTYLPIVLYPEVSQMVVKEFLQCCEHRQAHRLKILKIVKNERLECRLELLETGGVISRGQPIDIWNIVPQTHNVDYGSLSFCKTYKAGIDHDAMYFSIALKPHSKPNKQRIVFGQIDQNYYKNFRRIIKYLQTNKGINIKNCDIYYRAYEPPYSGPVRLDRPMIRWYIGTEKRPRAKSLSFYLYQEICADIVEELVSCCESHQTHRLSFLRYEEEKFLEFRLNMSRKLRKRKFEFDSTSLLTHIIEKGTISMHVKCAGGNYDDHLILRVSVNEYPVRNDKRIACGIMSKPHVAQLESFLEYVSDHNRLLVSDCELLHKGEFWKQKITSSNAGLKKLEEHPKDVSIGWFKRPCIYIYFENTEGERITHLPIILYPEVSQMVAVEFLHCCRSRQAFRLNMEKVVEGKFIEFSFELEWKKGTIKRDEPIRFLDNLPQAQKIEEGSLSFSREYKQGVDSQIFYFAIALDAKPTNAERIAFGRVDPKHLENLKMLVRYADKKSVFLRDCDVFYKEPIILKRPEINLNIIDIYDEDSSIELNFVLYPETVSHITEEFVECFANQESQRLCFQHQEDGLFAAFRLDLLRDGGKMKPCKKLKFDETNERTHRIKKGSLTIPTAYAKGKYNDHIIFHVSAQEIPGQSTGRIVFGGLSPNSASQFESFLELAMNSNASNVHIESCMLLNSGEPKNIIASKTDTGLNEVNQRRSNKIINYAQSIDPCWYERPRIYLYFDTYDGLRMTYLPLILYPEISRLLCDELVQCCERRQHDRLKIDKIVPGIIAGFSLSLLKQGSVLKKGEAIDAWHEIPRAHNIEKGSLLFSCNYEKGLHRDMLPFGIAANRLPEHANNYIVFGRVDPRFHHNLETYMYHATIDKSKVLVSDCDVHKQSSDPPYGGPVKLNRPLIRFYIGDRNEPRAKSFCFFLYPETCPDVVEEFVACCELKQMKRIKFLKYKKGEYLEFALDMSRQHSKKSLEYKDICNLTHRINKGSLSINKRYVGGNYDKQWIFRISTESCQRRCGQRIVFGGLEKEQLVYFESFLQYAEKHQCLRLHECELLFKGEFWKHDASPIKYLDTKQCALDENIIWNPNFSSWYERPYIYISFADEEGKRFSFLPIVLYPEVSQVIVLEFLKCCEKRQTERLNLSNAIPGLFTEISLQLLHDGELTQGKKFDIWHAAPQSHRIEEGSLSFPSNYENGIMETHFYFTISEVSSPKPSLDRTVFGRVDQKYYSNIKKITAAYDNGMRLKIDDCDLYYQEYLEPYVERLIYDRPVIQLFIMSEELSRSSSLCFNLYPEVCEYITRTLYECCKKKQLKRLTLLHYEEGKYLQFRLDLPKTTQPTNQKKEQERKMLEFDSDNELAHKIGNGTLSISKEYVDNGYVDCFIFQISTRDFTHNLKNRYAFGGLCDHFQPDMEDFLRLGAKTRNLILSDVDVMHEGVFKQEVNENLTKTQAEQPELIKDCRTWTQKPYIYLYFGRDDGKRIAFLPIALYPEVAQMVTSEFFQCCRKRQTYRIHLKTIDPGECIEFSLDLLKEHGFLKRGQEIKLMKNLAIARSIEVGSLMLTRSYESGLYLDSMTFSISLKSIPEPTEKYIVFGRVEPKYLENIEYLLHYAECEQQIFINDCDVFYREQVIPFTDPSLFNFETSTKVPNYLGWHERPYFYMHFDGDKGERISYLPIMLYPEISQMLTDEFLQCCRKRQAYRLRIEKILPGEFMELSMDLLKEDGFVSQGSRVLAMNAFPRAQHIEVGSLTFSKNYLCCVVDQKFYFSIALKPRAGLSPNRVVFGRIDPKHYQNLTAILEHVIHQKQVHISDCDVYYREQALLPAGPLKHNRPSIRFYIGVNDKPREISLSFYLYPEVVNGLTEELVACCLNKQSQRLAYIRSEGDLFAEFRLDILSQGGKMKAGKRLKVDFKNKRAHAIERGSLSIPIEYALCGYKEKIHFHLAAKAIPGKVATRIVFGKLAKESKIQFQKFIEYASSNKKIYVNDCELLYGDEYLKKRQDVFAPGHLTVPLNIEWVQSLCGWYERPMIYLYFAREDERRITYLPIKLYKEVAPEIVAEFLKCCSERKAERLNILSSVPGEFMEFGFELMKECPEVTINKPLTVKSSSAVACNIEAGSLTFPQIYEPGIPFEEMHFSISAKARPKFQIQQYVFGRIAPEHLRNFEILQQHIANGKSIHICDCDLHYTPYVPIKPDRPIIQLTMKTVADRKTKKLTFTLYPETCRKVVEEIVHCFDKKDTSRLSYLRYKEGSFCEFALDVPNRKTHDVVEFKNVKDLTHKITKGTLSIDKTYLEDCDNDCWIFHLAEEGFQEPIMCRIVFGSLCDDQKEAFDEFLEYAKENEDLIISNCELLYSGEI